MNRWLPFEWITAVRFLREGRLQTLFIIGGIAIGVGVIVFMSAMLAGLQANFIKRVLTSQPQIQLLAPDQSARPLRSGAGEFEDATVQRPSQRVISIDQWPKIRAQMLAMPEVTAVSPTMQGSALAVRGDASRAITLSGVEPDSYFRIVRVPDYVVAGEPRLTSEDIIIGIELAKDLGATVGDKLNIQAASGANRVLTISGLVDLGNKGANQRASFVALRTAQSLLGMIGGVTTIDMTVTDIYAAEALAQRIRADVLAFGGAAGGRVGVVPADPGAAIVRADRAVGDADGIARGYHAGVTRGETRSGGGDPWLKKSCTWRKSARPTMSGKRPRPRCCTISTSGWSTASSWR